MSGYERTMRNLVKEFLIEYKNDKFDDNYKKANEFLSNYSFGEKIGKPQHILDLEEAFQKYLTS